MARIWASLICVGLLACAVPAHAQALPGSKTVSIDGPESARVMAVRVDERLSERVLYDLASDLAAKHKPGETIAAISFFLPKSDLAAQPWAIARFETTPPEIAILGLRAEEEALFRSEAQLDARDVVGVWLTSPPALPGKLTILKSKDGLIAEWHLRNGQKTYDKLSASRSSRGVRYTVVGGDGAYYLAARGGELLLGDATRIIAVAERLPVDPNARLAASKAQASGLTPAVPAQATTTQATTTADAASASAAPVVPAAKTPRARSRRAVQAPAPKNGGFVADLMRGAIAR
ncbi:MAG: hypothetical protein JNL45_12660 [Hyphomicrobium sp.]|jgi:hypothetical protein|nr:hypothetical protein [Hyphomicrobium sp.]